MGFHCFLPKSQTKLYETVYLIILMFPKVYDQFKLKSETKKIKIVDAPDVCIQMSDHYALVTECDLQRTISECLNS